MSDIKYRHLRDPETNQLFATIGTIKGEDADNIYIAASICHEVDTPNKKLGKHIVSHRLMEGKGFLIPYKSFKVKFANGTILEYFINEWVQQKNPHVKRWMVDRAIKSIEKDFQELAAS